MLKDNLEIAVTLSNGKSVKVEISGSGNDPLYFMEGDESSEGETPNQLVEGKFYDYKIEKGYSLNDTNGIVSRNKFDKSIGRLSPNIYVGTLSLDIFSEEEKKNCGTLKLEVQSVKTSYREDYRTMLSDITEHCIELIFQHSSPVTQIVDIDYEKDPKALYQQFAFVKSILDTEDFKNAVHKVISSPVTKWKESETDKDIRGVRRLNSKALRQIVTSSNRIKIPEGHSLRELKLQSLPAKIKISYKTETADTPENRFVKHALKTFLSFITDFKSKLKEEGKTRLEASVIESYIEEYLGHSVFREISDPESIILNSPVLQRKAGYREILKVWLMFHLAAQLTWIGGDDVYDIGKRDVAVLYEYWLFFQLLKIIENVFGIKPKKDLITDTNDKLCLQLKQGFHFPIEGICDKYNRKLRIQFSYNRTFSGNNDYPRGGSWTRNMRPDYTLSIWPEGIPESEAEREEIIVHIHFDAKYKIENIIESFEENVDLDEEKAEQRKETYKRADLLKMHSYKDAIRRTSGAYILYPGQEKKTYYRMGFRELIPGLGAFQIRPSETGDNGSAELEKFFEDVVQHFLNRASQRENAAFRTYDIHKDFPKGFIKDIDAIPEAYAGNRSLIPDETYVLIAYCKSKKHREWITQHKLYNARTGTDKGSLRLGAKETGARYILLHAKDKSISGDLLKLKGKGPRIFSKDDMIKLSYPDPRHDFYLVYDIEDLTKGEFQDMKWDLVTLPEYAEKKSSVFAVSVSELMKQLLIK